MLHVAHHRVKPQHKTLLVPIYTPGWREALWDWGGVYMRKLAPAWVSHWGDFLISYRVYMMTGSFDILLFNGTFHVDKIHIWFKIQTLDMRYSFQSSRADRFHTKIGGRFAFTWYRCNIWYLSEILAPVREPGWTHTGVTRASITFWGGIM